MALNTLISISEGMLQPVGIGAVTIQGGDLASGSAQGVNGSASLIGVSGSASLSRVSGSGSSKSLKGRGSAGSVSGKGRVC